ncbi:MAG: NAD(P)-dependent oxidoreductase, partial [Desulfovibrio sp.]|nr:NAD(P)-dependent oxidoreductase [Desulfovibrio sp.]
AYERSLPCFQAMGKNFLYCGGPGQGQEAKLANQIAVAGVMFSVCESMLFAREAGLDVARWLELVVPGAAGSVAMNTLGRRLLNADYAPGFFIDHFVKDLGLCLKECRKMGLVLPGLALADQFYRMIQAQGYGKSGTQRLIDALANMSGKAWRKI